MFYSTLEASHEVRNDVVSDPVTVVFEVLASSLP